MSTASRFGAAFGAGLLGFMLLSSPAMAGPDESKKPDKTDDTEVAAQTAGNPQTDAHPGNHERQIENGGSGTQGKSSSNPDGAGVDKPYAADGQAAGSQGDSYAVGDVNNDDYDGNNGCGNDTDFADDNNGNCGGQKEDDDVDVDDDDDVIVKNVVLEGGKTESAQVMGIQIERAPATLAATAPAAQVLGVQMERAAPAALAATGLPLGLAALAGFGLIGSGLAARRVARS